MPGVTFETKCYENDWKLLLERDYLRAMIEKCEYSFDEKVLYINNVQDIKEVKKAADILINKNVLTGYMAVEDHVDTVLGYFNLAKESFKGGYFYSVAELTAIFFCKTEFLLHFSGDSIMDGSGYNWIDKAIARMSGSGEILVSNPTWNRRYWEAKKESFTEDEDWYLGYGFSDQCYLIRADNFRGEIYNEHNKASERYPKYGGELFEKRVDAYMRNNRLIRITSKHISYIHKNFPKSRLGKKLFFLLIKGTAYRIEKPYPVSGDFSGALIDKISWSVARDKKWQNYVKDAENKIIRTSGKRTGHS